MTHESTTNLGSKPGAEAFALIKSSAIILLVDDEGVRFSARNPFTGTESRIVPRAVNTEVVINLVGGGDSTIITNQSCTTLELAVSGTATAIFKASSVIVGVPV